MALRVLEKQMCMALRILGIYKRVHIKYDTELGFLISLIC